jgi:acetyl-CoA carboxylase beta subunit
MENGFLDLIVNRKDLRETLGDLLAFFDKTHHVEEAA